MNENKTIEKDLQYGENKTTFELPAEDDTTRAIIAAEPEAAAKPTHGTEQVVESAPRSAFLSRAARFAFFTLLPAVLALISITVVLALASSFLGKINVNSTALMRLMLGDIAGGYDYVTVDGSTTVQDPLPPLSGDSLSDTAQQSPAPSEGSASILTLSNETPYSPDMDEILVRPRAVPPLEELCGTYGSDAPIVLIIHTHTTESYADTADDGYRSSDKEKNMIAIGEIIADRLRERGISTLHCTEVFDSPDFGMAYYNASGTIRQYIREYPSISYVLDVHRDSIELSDGTSYAPTAVTTLGRAAQIMFVIGTDHGGSDHTEWEDNLALAARVQSAISADHPTLMRSINLRSASFNEQYTKGSLLIEVGATASTLDEAKLGAEILAEYLAREIIG
ncbi:MAG: stage II sporulation protein P [Clostridia bacterium]|nr:stage II sporulation protein P [Clostridia bacterium]